MEGEVHKSAELLSDIIVCLSSLLKSDRPLLCLLRMIKYQTDSQIGRNYYSFYINHARTPPSKILGLQIAAMTEQVPEKPQVTAHQDHLNQASSSPDQDALLKQFSAEIQGNILTVHNPCKEVNREIGCVLQQSCQSPASSS